ncbi:aminodeoxychorismate synthase component I [Myroides sp. 1354]|uniref:aminodeoxychorismate synthase component I n=1 Tax=unclassified Myroides TaxID=2642485 RepID=UPI002576626C|nr:MULTISPECIES: aminodeoxychorismate synthase component I [unclassified Myroides]MDM1044935.1 aminodeoxychorismate synthase component I [Myroides sp. R163-1]MDM1055648.1 aminodeoxychorismate synthase component I [Myroides sp. 1354]MDM1068945.1 aminodeoxychorismate synthase component I [Myroides sp. 1372]
MGIKDTIISSMNTWGKERKPFLFFVDYQGENGQVIPLDEVDNKEIGYNFNGQTNQLGPFDFKLPILTAQPIAFKTYETKFNQVMHQIQKGNTYLINLTVSTPIELEGSLKDIFHASKAKYKLWVKDNFVCFSPEIFVQIKENRIYSYPMKGTIDASIPQAEQLILADDKETAEHYTIVDLIRNDLNIVAKNVGVDRFRYLDRLQTTKGELLQMSSQISGDLQENWQDHVGDILAQLLPAGSITGSPKEKTVEIIAEVEGYARKYYTGICGIFDGTTLDSAVMIRFVEQQENQMVYKSGGGITFASQAEKEYKEILQKIYLPI